MYDIEKDISTLNTEYKRINRKYKKELQLIKLNNAIRKNSSCKNDQ